MPSFLHAADIHLDSPLRGLSRYDGAPIDQLRGASRQAFVRLVDLALSEEVSFVLLAGDLFDGDWKDYNTGLFLHQQLLRLGAADIDTYVIKGNHDATSKISKHLTWPDRVYVFSDRRPQSFERPDEHVILHGQSYRDRATTDDLAAAYPAPRPGWLNLGVLHTSVDGREGHAPYAPCTPRSLIDKGYDYWALGHVHAREVLHQRPWVVFPGNLQGRNVRETGSKGCTLVRYEHGAITGVEHRPVDVLRWDRREVDITGVRALSEVVDNVVDALAEAVDAADGRPLAVRVELVGRTDIHNTLHEDPERVRSEVLAAALRVGEVWVEKVKVRTRPPQVDSPEQGGLDVVAALLRQIEALRADPAALHALLGDATALSQRLPGELYPPDPDRPDQPGRLTDPSRLLEALDGARELLAAGLLRGER
jgi:exonuclease SbcD